jgi:hypothetical protein
MLTMLAFITGLTCLAQELELTGSLNTSSEQRFQSAFGYGLQYQHSINSLYKIGFGVHFNFNKSQFDKIPYFIASPMGIIDEQIKSNSNRFSIRLNIQRLLRDNENVSISLGPEISYNYLWGKDRILERTEQPPNYFNYSLNTGLIKDIGVGLISKIEIKRIILPELSLCFTIRPEILIGKNTVVYGADPPVFSGSMGFTEFQIGLNYRLKK